MSGTEVVVVGHHGVGRIIRVHAFPKPGETVTSLGQLDVNDSGKGGNQAICLGLLGSSTAFIGKVGDDEIGHLGAEWMAERGVDTSGIIFSQEMKSSQGYVFIDDQGQNTIINGFRLKDYISFEELKPAIQDHATARFFLTGFEIPVQVALQCTRFAKELGMFTIVNPSPAPNKEIGDLSYVDLLIPNEIEARCMLGSIENKELSILDIARGIRQKYNVKTLIITLGSDGLIGLDAQGDWRYPKLEVNIVDTLGAGDAFVGGLIWSLTENKTLRESSWCGNCVAALSVTKQGSFPSYPNKKEVIELIKNHPCQMK
jgi:ribokinase